MCVGGVGWGEVCCARDNGIKPESNTETKIESSTEVFKVIYLLYILYYTVWMLSGAKQ